jgi:hypothetical protein
MTDYRVTVTVKNARILQAMEKAGFDSVAGLAKELGVHVRILYPLLSMQISPMTRGSGRKSKSAPLKWRPVVEKLSIALSVPIEQLFSPTQLNPTGAPTRKSIDVSEKDLNAYIVSASVAAPMLGCDLETTDLLTKVIAQAKLTPKEHDVIKRRFFYNETLEEIGADYSVCRARVQEIEKNALRKLKSPNGINLYKGASE